MSLSRVVRIDEVSGFQGDWGVSWGYTRANSSRETPRSRRIAETVPGFRSRLPQFAMVVLPPVDGRTHISWSPRARVSSSHPSLRSLRASSRYLKPRP